MSSTADSKAAPPLNTTWADCPRTAWADRSSRHIWRCPVCNGERLNYFGEPYARWPGRRRWVDYCFACAADAENARIRERRTQARADRTCENCGATFTPRRADGRYCWGACRQAAYRQRQGISSDTG